MARGSYGPTWPHKAPRDLGPHSSWNSSRVSGPSGRYKRSFVFWVLWFFLFTLFLEIFQKIFFTVCRSSSRAPILSIRRTSLSPPLHIGDDWYNTTTGPWRELGERQRKLEDFKGNREGFGGSGERLKAGVYIVPNSPPPGGGGN